MAPVSDASRTPTAFVGMLRTDEAQFAAALSAVRSQEGCRVSYEVIGGFEEQEASRRLYSGFNDGVGRFDVRARVDADMVITSPRLLAAAAHLFAEDDRVDTITVGLEDFFTGAEIKGIHLWRREVRWLSMPGALFGDAVFDTSRRTLTVVDLPRPVALHAPEPSAAQSARYGSHRALKALVKGPTSKNWVDHRAVVATQRSDPHPARLLAIAAIVDVIEGQALDQHLEASLGRQALDVDRLAALSQEPDLIGRASGILEDPDRLSRICTTLGPVVRAVTARETPRGAPRHAGFVKRARQSWSYRVHGSPDEAALRGRFLELLRLP